MGAKTVIFGDVSEDLYNFGKPLGTRLLDKTNLEIAKQDQHNYHTSIGDIDVDQAVDLVRFFDQVIIQTKPIDHWTSVELLKTTLYVCRYLNHSFKVKNLEYYVLDELVYQDYVPDCSEPALYLFGGSTVAGDFLANQDDRFGELLGRKRNLKIINHAKSGCGLRRSFEQLMLSNPKPNDVVILDSATPTRMRIANRNQVQDLMLHNCSKNIIMSLTDEQIFYNHISYLDAFIKHTQLLKVKFVFYSNQFYDETYFDYMLNYSKKPQWCLKTSNVANSPVDFCHDNQHPGPASHAIMAQLLDQKIIQLYESSNLR